MNEIEIIPQKTQVEILQKPIIKQEMRKYWSKEEINDKLNRIPQEKQRESMFLRFLWMSGVRISEAIGIKKGDIDFQNYVIRIRWLKSRKYSERMLPMHPRLRELLYLYTSQLNKDEKVFNFNRQYGHRIVRKYFNGHPHQLRHSFAVNWLQSDGDLVTLSRMLGHKNINTTMEYLKIVPMDQGKELIKVKFE